MKVPLCTVVLLCIIVPLHVGIADPPAVYEVVELVSLHPPAWEQAYALVTFIAAISEFLQKDDTKGREGIQSPFCSAAVQS